MKRVSILLLCLLLALTGLTACGRDKNKNEADKGNQNQNNMTQNQGGMQSPGGEIADGAGEVIEGTARGVRDLWDRMMEAFDMDGRPRTVEGDAEAYAAYGLREDLIEDYILHVPENGDTAHEFLIARVREGKMAEVEQILEKRKEAIAAKWAEDANDAMAYAREPVIYKNGNYIMLAVYENPDMTPDERTAAWRDLEKKYMPWRDYGEDNDFFNRGGWWYHKLHIFHYPFYYINYTLTTMGALEFKKKCALDKAAGWQDYMTLCKLGGSLGYLDTLRAANLANPFEEGGVKRAVDYAINILKEKIKE